MTEEKKISSDEFRRALEEHAFVPYFQPQYNYLRQAVCGAEILARWQQPDGTMRSPKDFIPEMESDDRIVELDFQIMEKAAGLVRKWLDEGIDVPPVSLNLSRKTVLSENMINRIKEIMIRYRLMPEMIHLELTESVYAENYELIYERGRVLKRLGFVLEMDDFGSGYSSLGVLRDAPMDVIKMDMSFLKMDGNREKGGSIITSVVRMAEDLHMEVIAEGVENREQAEFLKSVGCSTMQGYYFSSPLSPEDFREEMLLKGVFNLKPLPSNKKSTASDYSKFSRELSDIINEADTAIVVTDLKTNAILFANQKALEIGQTTTENVIGKTCYRCLNRCDSVNEKCVAVIPAEGTVLDEVRDGKVYRIRRKRIDWNGIDAGICYITDRTDTVFRDNSLVEHSALERLLGKAPKVNPAEENAENGEKKWENIFRVLKNRKGESRNLLTDDKMRIRIQFMAVYIVLGIVSLGMTLMNALTGWARLGNMTLVYGLVNIVNVALCLWNEKAERLTQGLFAVEIVTLFTGFAILGEPEGFAILWSVLLPTLGMLLYGIGKGSLVSGIQWLILAFLFWTPVGRSLLGYPYTESFLERFPVLYASLFCLGILFEYIRRTTQSELVELRQQFEYLYNHDALTGLYNRYGFNSSIQKLTENKSGECLAFAILDLDDFKRINDNYGHIQGDKVLKNTAQIISDLVGDRGIVCRWGGEEFSILFYDGNKAKNICDKILEKCKNYEYLVEKTPICVTMSVGLVEFEGFSIGGTSEVITMADKNLYQSKKEGKDRITESYFTLK